MDLSIRCRWPERRRFHTLGRKWGRRPGCIRGAIGFEVVQRAGCPSHSQWGRHYRRRLDHLGRRSFQLEKFRPEILPARPYRANRRRICRPFRV